MEPSWTFSIYSFDLFETTDSSAWYCRGKILHKFVSIKVLNFLIDLFLWSVRFHFVAWPVVASVYSKDNKLRRPCAYDYIIWWKKILEILSSVQNMSVPVLQRTRCAGSVCWCQWRTSPAIDARRRWPARGVGWWNSSPPCWRDRPGCLRAVGYRIPEHQAC